MSLSACPRGPATTCATSRSSPTSTTARPPWSTPCSGSPAPSARTSTSTSGRWTPATWSARRASRSSPRTPRCTGAAAGAPERPGTSPSTSSTPPATPTSAARSSAGCRWSTASSCSSTPPRARCRRPGSCCARRCRRTCRSSWWSTRSTARTPASPRSSTRPTSCSWTCSTAPGSTRTLLDFPIVYASAKAGRASPGAPEGRRHAGQRRPRAAVRDDPGRPIPAPVYDDEAPLQAHVTNLDASPFLGRLALLPRRSGHDPQGPAGRLVPARRLLSSGSRSPSC